MEQIELWESGEFQPQNPTHIISETTKEFSEVIMEILKDSRQGELFAQ